MLDLYTLYAPGLALLRVTVLKNCGLWTSGNLLLDLLLLWNEPTDVGPTCDDDGRKLNIWRDIQVLTETDTRKMFLFF
jgi:hypothetical protein